MSEKDAPKPNIFQRMNFIMGKCPPLAKTNKGLYPYVPHDVVSAALRPLMAANGVMPQATLVEWGQDGKNTWAIYELTFINADNPEDRYGPIRGLGYGVDSQDKGPGKAATYALKTAYLKAFCLEGGTAEDIEAHNDLQFNNQHTQRGRDPQQQQNAQRGKPRPSGKQRRLSGTADDKEAHSRKQRKPPNVPAMHEAIRTAKTKAALTKVWNQITTRFSQHNQLAPDDLIKTLREAESYLARKPDPPLESTDTRAQEQAMKHIDDIATSMSKDQLLTRYNRISEFYRNKVPQIVDEMFQQTRQRLS